MIGTTPLGNRVPAEAIDRRELHIRHNVRHFLSAYSTFIAYPDPHSSDSTTSVDLRETRYRGQAFA